MQKVTHANPKYHWEKDEPQSAEVVPEILDGQKLIFERLEKKLPTKETLEQMKIIHKETRKLN